MDYSELVAEVEEIVAQAMMDEDGQPGEAAERVLLFLENHSLIEVLPDFDGKRHVATQPGGFGACGCGE